MQNGIEIPIEDYHQLSANGSGDVRLILKSKYQYYAKKVAKIQQQESKSAAQILGDVVHCMVLEPWRFEDQYITLAPRKRKPDSDPREVIREPDYRRALEATRAVRHSLIADACIEPAKDPLVEKAFVTSDKATGLDIKCRPDVLHDDRIVDLKTTQDASPREFAKSCAKYGYHIQAAFYRHVIESVRGERLPFFFVCVETRWPFNVAVYRLNDVALAHGEAEVRRGLELISECHNTDNWKDDWTQTPQVLSLPEWAYFSDEDEDELVGFES